MEKKQLSVMCSKEIADKFQRLYPQCLTKFIQNALKLSCDDKELFIKIYFDNLEK